MSCKFDPYDIFCKLLPLVSENEYQDVGSLGSHDRGENAELFDLQKAGWEFRSAGASWYFEEVPVMDTMCLVVVDASTPSSQEFVRQYPFNHKSSKAAAEQYFEIHRNARLGFLYWQAADGRIVGVRFPSLNDELRFEQSFKIAKERNSAAISRIEAVQSLGQNQRRARWQCSSCLLFWPNLRLSCDVCTYDLQVRRQSTPANNTRKQRLHNRERPLLTSIPVKRQRLRVIKSEEEENLKPSENCKDCVGMWINQTRRSSNSGYASGSGSTCSSRCRPQAKSRTPAVRTTPLSEAAKFKPEVAVDLEVGAIKKKEVEELSEEVRHKVAVEGREEVDRERGEHSTQHHFARLANITKSRGSKCGASTDITGWLLTRLPLLTSEDSHAQLLALRQISSVLTRREDSVWRAVAGGVPRFVELLESGNHQAVQREAAGVLAQLAGGSGAYAEMVARKGAATPLSRLLLSDADSVRATALRALHRISDGSAEARMEVLRAPGTVPALEALSNVCGRKPAELRRAAALLMSLCDGLRSTETAMARCLLKAIQSLILLDETEVLVFTCWALTHLMEGPHLEVASGWALTHLTWRRVVALLSHNASRVQVPALRALGQLLYACCDTQATSAVFDDLGAVAALAGLLHHEERCLRMDACWALSNAAADGGARARQVADCSGLLVQLTWMLAQDDWAVKAEAVWVVLRLAEHRDVELVERLLEMDCVSPLAHLLRGPDVEVVIVSLHVVGHVLDTKPKANLSSCVLSAVEDCFKADASTQSLRTAIEAVSKHFSWHVAVSSCLPKGKNAMQALPRRGSSTTRVSIVPTEVDSASDTEAIGDDEIIGPDPDEVQSRNNGTLKRRSTWWNLDNLSK